MSLPPDAIPGFLATENVIIYNMVASSTLVLWDYCLTFGEEMRLIWRRRMNYISFLFLSVRYLTIIVKIAHLIFYTDILGLLHPTIQGCVAWSWFQAMTGHLAYFILEIILIMRIFAFYERRVFVLVILIILLIIEHAPSFVFLGLTLPKFKFLPNPFPKNIQVSACIITFVPKAFANYWAPAFGFQAILFLLLLCKFIHTRLRTTVSTPRLLTIFVRDGAWAFLLIFVTILWNQLAFVISPQNGEIALAWLYAAFGFCGSRLILNLKVAARKSLLPPPTAADTYPLTPLSPISPGYSSIQHQSFGEVETPVLETPISGIKVEVTSYSYAVAI